MLALVSSACGHYSFESAVTRSDANDGADADSDGGSTDGGIDPGLLVWLDCDAVTGGVMADASGHGSIASCDAALNQCPAVISNGPRGKACQFDGVNDVVTVAPDNRFQPATFTVAVWLRVDTTPGFYGAAWIKHGSNPSQEVWAVYDYTNPGTGTDTLQAGGGLAGDAYTDLGAPMPLVWTHVAATFEGTSYTAYRNGVAQPAVVTQALGDTMNELVFGAEGATNTRVSWWAGALDDARLYDRVLSQAEITTLAMP